MNRSIKTLCIVALSAILGACGNSEEAQMREDLSEAAKAMEEAFKDNPQKAEDVVKGLSDALSSLGNGVETVPAKELKAFLPVEVGGMTRTAYSASKKGIKGFSISFTDAKFEEDDGRGDLQLTLTDIGNMSGVASIGLDVLDVEIDEENQHGFQRTETYKGYKSFRKHSRVGGSSQSEMMVFVGDRFVVKALGNNIEWDLLEDVVDSIPVDDLEDLIN